MLFIGFVLFFILKLASRQADREGSAGAFSCDAGGDLDVHWIGGRRALFWDEDRMFGGRTSAFDPFEFPSSSSHWGNGPSSFLSEINPASGLPMIGSVDVAGNSYGFSSMWD